MKIAFPFQKDMVANHFCKAGDFCCWDLDDSQNHIAFTNPSTNDDCAGHQLIVERLVDFGVSTVLVRQIGQRMLSRLLDKSISVWQLKGPLAAQDLAQYQQHWEQVATALTEVSQGRESVKFAQKHSCSDGCGAKQTCAEHEHHHGCGHCHCSHH
ncbi:NifB/NifX family molybdenum-iron cluster-binding protein [Celerinatantimonas sp. MCCC 1A17872]|uniref:NifB/NifX family molybdenum-iron cluster-binding protein n=1 Tax=Celerinatantimonas sp. MCCC 1A17872 TaxID=3177514 RepID=UPI0038BE4F5B